MGDARRLCSSAECHGDSLRSRFAYVEDEELLQPLDSLLRFNPQARASAATLLQNEVFDKYEVRDLNKEGVSVPAPMTAMGIDLEPSLNGDRHPRDMYNGDLLRRYICREIQKWHPD